MGFSETPQAWRMRNIKYGERGTEKRRRELSEYANLLQARRTQGQLAVAESQQEFERPEQEARIARIGEETEGLDIANTGQRFYQGLAKKYGPMFMRQDLGLPESESGAVRPWSLPKGYDSGSGSDSGSDLRPKSDISDTRSPVASITSEGSSLTDAWDRSTRTPVGRMFDLENITEALRKTWKGLDYVGKGMEKGVGRGFKYLFTPRKRTKEEKDRAAKPFGIDY